MAPSRQLRLGAFMRPATIHTGAWRYPGAFPDANFNFAHIKRFAQTLERGKFDAFFMADHLAVLNMPLDALKRSHTATSFEPFTLLSALAGATEHIGLVATGSTTFDAPYHVARRFASLDHISGGRAGWNIVTTSNPDAALNFGLDEHVEHGERYHRAREFYDVSPACGTVLPATPSSAMPRAGSISTRPGCTCSTTRDRSFRCEGRSTSRGRRRAGRSSCRPAPPKRAGSWRPKPPRWCSQRMATWRQASASTRT
jgi:alkanesulfonate monooxygenase